MKEAKAFTLLTNNKFGAELHGIFDTSQEAEACGERWFAGDGGFVVVPIWDYPVRET